MNYKEIIKTRLNNITNLPDLNRFDSQIIYDFSSEENKSGTKINEEKFYEKLNSENKKNPKEKKTEKKENNNSINKEYKITNFNFYIINKKNSVNSDLEHASKDNSILNKKETKKRGRKRKRNDIVENENNENYQNVITHDRYSDDNMRKKCKNIVLKIALEFLNQKIKEQYNNNIGKGKNKKELKILNQEEKVNQTVNIEKTFLSKTLKEIFSENISSRLSNFSLDHNKLLIESLIKEDDEEKKQYFIKLFNITFMDCVKCFIGEKTDISELDGFKSISSIKENLVEEHGEEYVEMLIYYLKNFKDIIDNKKSRNKKSNKSTCYK